jgi:hypothetical protein
MVALSSLAGAGWQFFGNNGLPLAGGKLYTYAAGTTTPLAAYTSISGATPHANPIVLDSAGRVPSEVWLTSTANYKFTLKTAADVEIWTKDNVPGIAASTDLALYVTYANLASTAVNKGASLVGFDGFDGASTVDEALGWLRNSVNVQEFGAVGDGVTDDIAAIQAAVDYAYANGLDVAYPANIPAFYAISRCIICRPGVSHRGVGGYAKIKNTRAANYGNTLDRAVFLPGNLFPGQTQSLTFYNCGTIQPGVSVTLTTPADAANFAVGDQIVTASTAFALSGGLKDFDYMHLNRVKAIVGAVITLEYPIDVSYAGGIALLAERSSLPPVVEPLFFAENCAFQFLDVESNGLPIGAWSGMYNVTFSDCIVKGQSSLSYGNTFQYCRFERIRSYFSDRIGEYALNSLYTTTTNCSFTYFNGPTNTGVPFLRFQIAEASRGCRVTGNTIDLNDLSVTAGYSIFTFNDCNYCEYSDNTVTSSSAASNITGCTFVGRPTADGLRCSNNSFSRNILSMNDIRLFVYLGMVDNTNVQNLVEGNLFTANTGTFTTYSVRLDNSYSNYISNNKSNFGAIFFNDTVSSGNIIENNYFPLGFGANETSLTDNYYQQNVLRNNASAASVVKQSLALASASSVNAPASTATTVYTDNIGTNMATRDRYEFEFYIQPTGVANTKPIVFNLRDNTPPASDIALFSHTIPAASTGLVVVKTTVVVKGAGAAAATTTTVYDTTAGTTTTYASTFTRPAVDKDLSFNFIATPGAGVSLSFVQISANYSNPYN